MHTEIGRRESITNPPAAAVAEGSGPTATPARAPQADVFGNIFIGIAGMIGAGKSTLAAALGQHLGIETYYEPVTDNEYLSDFYRDTARHSFAMQVYLLNRRFQQHQEIIWRGRSAVQDRTIYEDSIFAKMLARTGLMDDRDYKTYVQLFRNMSNFMCKPSVIVYLDVSPEASAERIAMRSRDVEAKIELGYLRALHEGYQEFGTVAFGYDSRHDDAVGVRAVFQGFERRRTDGMRREGVGRQLLETGADEPVDRRLAAKAGPVTQDRPCTASSRSKSYAPTNRGGDGCRLRGSALPLIPGLEVHAIMPSATTIPTPCAALSSSSDR